MNIKNKKITLLIIFLILIWAFLYFPIWDKQVKKGVIKISTYKYILVQKGILYID